MQNSFSTWKALPAYITISFINEIIAGLAIYEIFVKREIVGYLYPSWVSVANINARPLPKEIHIDLMAFTIQPYWH